MYKKSGSILLKNIIIIFLFSHNVVIAADVWDKWGSHKQEYQENEGIEDYVWKEGSSQLPEYPQDSDLSAIMGPAAYRNYRYLIDIKTLVVGTDDVVRYSIVIRSSSGSDNVMFEGLRCSTHQVINYAYGYTDMNNNKKFREKNNTNWKPLRSDGVMGYSSILAMDYFCDHNGVTLKRHEIIQNIKYGKGPVDGLYN